MEYTDNLISLEIVRILKPLEIFHMDNLIAYYIELSIIERQHNFNRLIGIRRLYNLLNSIVI